ncbi:MAG: sphinganine kinase lcb4 [Claussenomyces sp. TS43310]|nr:MAG: sphinganine kinase lcb4 [Claussenomyces sp. TS43310]
MTAPHLTVNPFEDQTSDAEDCGTRRSFAVNSTLAVGRNASLTLGTDSLIVLDEAFDGKANCCGLWPSGSSNTRAIPFYNILWAELVESEIRINYALLESKNVVRPAILSYAIESSGSEVEVWISKLLDRAYGESQKQKRAKVLLNPHAGKGRAVKWYHRDIQPILEAARCSIDLVQTEYQGEAIEVAENLDINAYDMVVSCSGDGIPHEVFNGLGRRPDAKRALGKIAVVQLPCGSGNAMSCNLNGTDSPTLATLAVVKGIVTPLDLISITQGTRRTLSFLSQSVGIVAESDLGTDHLRWMGAARFTFGFLVRLLGKTVYPCDIAVKSVIDDKPSIKEHYRREQANYAPLSERRGNSSLFDDDVSTSSGSELGLPSLRYGSINDKLPEGWNLTSYNNLGNFYCGNMGFMAAEANFFAPALPNDGLMDLVNIDGNISRLSALGLLTSVENGKFFDNPLVNYRKIEAYRIIPKNQADGYISIDGERVPFEPFQAEIHRGLGTVLSKSGHIYEAPGPS